MASLSQSQDYSFEANWRIMFRDLLRIAPSYVVDMVAQDHINHPGQYPHPSYYINHLPTTTSLSQPNMFATHDAAATNSYHGYNGHTINPQSSLNFQEIDDVLITDDFDAATNSYHPGDHHTIINPPSSLNFQETDDHVLITDDFDAATEFENWDWLFDHDDVQETATAPADSVVDGNRSSQDEDIYKECLKTRRSREEDQIQGNICVVCLDDLHANENNDDDDQTTIATLRCGHEYHMDCIKSWLRQKNVCPLCKASVLPEPEH